MKKLVIYFLIIGFILAYFFPPEAYRVKVKSSIAIREIVNLPATGLNIKGHLMNNDVVYVVDCIDYKSDVALEVEVPSKSLSGYISEGDFFLRKINFSDINIYNLKYFGFSCNSMFSHRKLN